MLSSLQPSQRLLRWANILWISIHWILLAAVYGFFASKAFLQFSLNGDVLAFHLPRALSYFNLTTYEFGVWAEKMAKGYPALPNVVQGFLVLVTGRPSAVNAVNVVGLLWAMTWICILYGKRFSVRWFLTFCLAFPLFYFHITIGFIDLFTASMILTGFAGLYGVITRHRIPLSATVMAMGLTLAMFSKMTAWPVVAVLALSGLYHLWRQAFLRHLSAVSASAFSLLLVAGTSYFPVRNYLLFGNPTFPIELKTVMYTLPTVQVTSKIEKPNLPRYMERQSNQSRFISSLMETNRSYRPIPFDWKVFQNHGRLHERDQAGGLFSVSVLAMFILLLVGFGMGWLDKPAMTAFAACIVVASVLPNSAILRYSLFMPLIASFLVALSFRIIPFRFRVMIGCGFFFLAGVVTSQLGASFWKIDMRAPESFASLAARNFWDSRKGQDTTAQILTKGAFPATIFWSGPTFREYRIKEDLENNLIDPRIHLRR